MAGPVKVDLPVAGDVFYRGDDFSQLFRFKVGDAAEDLTGWTWLAQIRGYTDAADPPMAAFTVTCPTPTSGEVTIALTAAQTAMLSRQVVYDLQGTKAGAVQTRVFGKITVTEDVSR